MKRIVPAVLFALLMISPAAGSDAFRCGGDLVNEGDTMYEVIRSCGEPSFVRSWQERRVKRDFFRDIFGGEDERPGDRERQRLRFPFLVVEEVQIEEWTYDLGPNRFIRYLLFENGRLVDITTGDYGR
ncbi:MAG: DUF2845 domain-containing protein [Thermodesulfovibrionales bacterium]